MRNIALDRRLFFLLERARNAVMREAKQSAAAQGGVSPAQAGVLFLLSARADQAVSMSAIANALDLSPSAVTGLVARMEAQGLARRLRPADDQRSVLVEITAAGEKARQHAQAFVQDATRELLADFSETEQDVIFRFLNHLAARAPRAPTDQETIR